MRDITKLARKAGRDEPILYLGKMYWYWDEKSVGGSTKSRSVSVILLKKRPL